MKKFTLLFTLLASAATPAIAQRQQDDGDESTIVVTGQRPRGSIVGDTPAEISLNPGDIRAFGATNLTDLLAQLAPQTGGGRGEGGPVVLLNGKRISGFGEIREIPQEAIVRVEIFPPEVGLRYGYPATQRVVNVILRPRFSAVNVELSPGFTTEGGRESVRGEISLLRIRENSRTSLAGQFQHQEPILDSQRDIPQEFTPDARPFRTLLSSSNSASLNGTISRSIFGDISASLNGRVDLTDSRAGLGLDVTRPLLRDSKGTAFHAGLAMGSKIGQWQWNLTSNFDAARNGSKTDRNGQTVRDTATARTRNADVNLVVNGGLFRLPAGLASATFGLGGKAERIESDSVRLGVPLASTLSRSVGHGQASIDLPITSRNKAVLGEIGTLSLNANAAFDKVSGFGTLTTLGYGAGWSPVKGLDLTANVSHEEEAPTIRQLGNPVEATPNVRVFDYVRGETVSVSRIDGGNGALSAARSRVTKFAINAKPFSNEDLSLIATYTNTNTKGAILNFPTATAALSAAFPARFQRNVGGQLISVDARPINVSETRQSNIRWGLNFSKRLGKAPVQPQRNPFEGLRGSEGGAPGGPGGQQGGQQQGGGPQRGGFGGGPGGPGGFGAQPRIQFALYHTWDLRDDIQLQPGVARLNLLDGDAVGNQGGASRHKLEAQGGYSKNGMGLRFSANWQSATTVQDGTNRLNFGDLTTFDLRFFINLGQQQKLVAKHPWMRGMQIFVGINNVFDSKQRVTDATGLTPVSLLQDRIDPQGRSVRISIRKLFSSFRPGQQPQRPPGN